MEGEMEMFFFLRLCVGREGRGGEGRGWKWREGGRRGGGSGEGRWVGMGDG